MTSFKHDLEWTLDAVLVNTIVGEENEIILIIWSATIAMYVYQEKVPFVFTLKGFTGNNLGFAFCGKEKDRFIFVVAELSKKSKNVTGRICVALVIICTVYQFLPITINN